MQHVGFEGLPGVGKTAILSLLKKFYSERVIILPNIVKDFVNRKDSHPFRDREQLAHTILRQAANRRQQIKTALIEGKMCLEESHLGVYLAYAQALEDRSFIEVYPTLKTILPFPDTYLRLEIPLEIAQLRQRSHQKSLSNSEKGILQQMLAHLHAWHIKQGNCIISVDANRDPSDVLAAIEKALGLSYRPSESFERKIFEYLLLLGRPASGKSEFIDFMKNCPLERRMTRYYLGKLHTVDDFVMLWEKFEEDNLWEKLGQLRLFSKRVSENYTVINDQIWPFLIEKINIYTKEYIQTKPDYSRQTILIEFSRGGKTAYANALNMLSPTILSRTAILYFHVSPEESRRRNIARYDKERKDTILRHAVPRNEMKRVYEKDDWQDIAPQPSGRLLVNKFRIPYVTMNNEPESADPAILDRRYHNALETLYRLWQENHP